MKMDLNEFRMRLSDIAAREQPVSIVDHERVIGHYVPVANHDPDDIDIEGWAASRLAARARWIARTPDWQARLMRLGLDEDGEPYDNEPRP